jgi:hypothetical protein
VWRKKRKSVSKQIIYFIQSACLRLECRVARWFVFKPKIPIWVNFGGLYVDWKRLIYFMAICNILRTFGKFYDHLVNFLLIWYIYYGFGITYQQKSGNPA